MSDVRAALPSRAARVRRYLLSRSVVFQLLVLEGCILAVVLSGLSELDAASHTAFMLLKLVVASALCFYAVYGLIEALAAFKATRVPPVPDEPLPATTAIVPAYLPNEAEIILETARHHLAAGPSDMQLIVAYNTPEPLPVEAELARLAHEDPRLVLVRVEGSRSKAANINAAIDVATGDIVGVFDADHHPAPGNFEQAWRWLAAGADVVQGRCAVREQEGRRRGIVSMAVSAEFEEMYAVGHAGRTKVMGIGLFGGSNGFWRAETLRRVRFDPTALTEDIDASVRLLRSGGRVVTDRSIVSTELPPPGIVALCNQRLRWAQGWFQVSRRHLAAVSIDPRLPKRHRFGIFWLFGLGTILPWVAAVGVPLTLHGWFNHDVSPLSRIIAVLFMFGSASFVLHVSVAFRYAVRRPRKLVVFGTYIASNFVFYAYLRVALVRLAHLHEVLGRFEWRVTPRSSNGEQGAVVGVQEWAHEVPADTGGLGWLPSPTPVPALATIASATATEYEGAAPFGDVVGVRSFFSIMTNRALDRIETWERSVRSLVPRRRAARALALVGSGSPAMRATRAAAQPGAESVYRLGALGLVATLAVTVGASQPGSPFVSAVSGSWFLGGSHVGTHSITAMFGIVAVFGGLILFMRVWLGLLRVLRANRGFTVKPLVAMLALWAIPVVVAPPLFSSDVYSYAAQGEMVSHGINPYAYGPDVLGADAHVSHVATQLVSAASPSGPLFERLAGVVTVIAGHGELAAVIWLRLLELLGLLLLALSVPALARSGGRDPATAFALTVLNPITLFQLLGGGHDDLLMLGLLVAGITVARRRRPWTGIFLCALAGAIKAPALLGVLYIGWDHAGVGAVLRERLRSTGKALAIAGATLGVATWISGFGWGGWEWITNLTKPGVFRSLLTPTTLIASGITHLSNGVGIQASMVPVLTVVRLLGFAAALLVARSLLLHTDQLDAPKALGLALFAFVALGPLAQPWYLAWGLLVLAPIASGWLRSAVIGASVAGTFVGLGGGRLLVSDLLHVNVMAGGIALAALLLALTVPLTIRSASRSESRPSMPPLQPTPELIAA